MTWIILFLIFPAMLAFELYTDVKGARSGKNDNHGKDAILRGIGIAVGSWFASEGNFVDAVNIFAVTSLVYWVLFDALFNLAQNKSLFYTGDGVKDSFFDQIMSDRPKLFFFVKLFMVAVTSVALLLPVASYFVLFWSFFLLLTLFVVFSADFRYLFLKDKFALSAIMVGAIDFVSAIIMSKQGIPDYLIIISLVVPFACVVLFSNIYHRVWK